MSRFTKKPVTIEAVQFLGCDGAGLRPIFDTGQDEPVPWLAEALQRDPHEVGSIVPTVSGGLFIMTLEGMMRADPKDWIIHGVEDEIYPCKPTIFALTYEEPDDVSADPAAE